MAHMLEMNNDVASFVSVLPEWHSLGKVFGRCMTLEEAVRYSNADRNIEVKTIALPDDTEWGITPRELVVLESKLGITDDMVGFLKKSWCGGIDPGLEPSRARFAKVLAPDAALEPR